MKRLKHPATAVLFYDWMLNRNGGQKALQENNAEPARVDLSDRSFKGAKLVSVRLASFLKREDFWNNKYEKYIRLAGS